MGRLREWFSRNFGERSEDFLTGIEGKDSLLDAKNPLPPIPDVPDAPMPEGGALNYAKDLLGWFLQLIGTNALIEVLKHILEKSEKKE